MKKLFLLSLLTLTTCLAAPTASLAQDAPSQRATFHAELGYAADEFLVTNFTTTDTARLFGHRWEVFAKDGVVDFSFPAEGVCKVLLAPMTKWEPTVEFYLFPGDSLSLTGTATAPVFSGTPYADDLTLYYRERAEALADVEPAYRNAMRQWQEADAKTSGMVARFREEGDRYAAAVGKFNAAFVARYPAKDIAVFVASQNMREVSRLAEGIAAEVKAGPMHRYLATYLSNERRLEEYDAKERAKEALTSPGTPAPEFTLPGLDGKPVSLSDFRGRYVVLDFWGSWCIWCIRGLPEMKKSYAALAGKVEFIGLDVNDTEEAWKAAVEKHEIPWVNVRDDGETTVQKYGVRGYPSKCIIDPEGKVVRMFVGEDPDFYKFLEETVQ